MNLFQRKDRSYSTGTLHIGDSAIAERISFLGLTADDLGVVASWASECRQALPVVSERFYAAITRSAGARGVLEKHSSIAKQRPAMERYLSSLFDGKIDDAWIAVRVHVGKRHDDIDLDCMFYFGGYEVLRDSFGRAVESAGASRADLRRFNDSFARLLYADAALTLNALMLSRSARVAKACDQQAVIAKFVESMGGTVHRMAEQDLTALMY